MQKLNVRDASLLMTAALCLTSLRASAVDPNPVTPPYVSSVYTTSSGGDGHGAEFVFWKNTWRNTPANLASLKSNNTATENGGRYPVTAFTTWLSGPIANYLPGGANYYTGGESDFAQWINARGNLRALTAEGTDPYANNAYISPMMPLDAVDWPAGVSNATFGDWCVSQLSGYYGATGTRGMFASDGWDNLWGFDYDYNQRVINDFATKNGITVTGATTTDKANFIKANYLKQWHDYKGAAYANMFGGLAKAVWDGTGKAGFIGLQGTGDGWSRRYGQDLRQIANKVQANNGKFFKVVELQGDNQRPLATIGASLTGALAMSCNVPDAWVGAQLTAPGEWPLDAEKQASQDWVTSLNQSGTWASSAERNEFFSKYMRAQWLTVGWAHIANTNGTVRRAMQAFHRQYADSGKVPADIENLLQTIRPVRPFGAALYYSRSIADKSETLGSEWSPAMSVDGVGAVPVGYAVSDLTLGGFATNPKNKPTSFLTSDVNLLPAAELQKLKTIAPVYDAKTVASLPSPVNFSGDANGYGFIDQNGRSIFVVTRDTSLVGKMNQTGNSAITQTMSFKGIANGTYTLVDLFDSTKSYSFTVKNGVGSVSFPMARWECRAFRSTIPSPNGNWTAPAVSNLMLQWKLDESSGATWAMDASGGHRFGQLQGTNPSTVWTVGYQGNGLSFDGSGEVSSSFTYPSTNFTQSLCFKTSTKPTYFYYTQDSYKGTVSDGMTLDSNGNINAWPLQSQGKNYADGHWHVVALVRESGVGSRLYVDGALAASNNTGDSISAATKFILGGYDWWGHYTGVVDDVRVYNRVLSATEIAALAPGLTPTPTPSDGSAYSGVISLPAKVEAENFNTGGQNVAYNDSDAANQGGQYRTSEGVDIETTSDTGGGYNVGYTSSGEWMKYAVNVASAGTYDLTVRVASISSGGTMHVEFGGVDRTGSITVPNTGNWQTWQNVTINNISLAAGAQTMRVVVDSGGFNLNFVQVSAPTPTPTPTPTPSAGPNLLTNSSFDAEGFDTQTPSGWSEWSGNGGVGSGYTESYGGSNSGARHGSHYNPGAYNMYAYQTKTGLANGLYTARAYAQRTGTQTACQLEAKDFGSSTRAAAIPVSSTYQLVEIKDINVTNGQCTVGIWSDAPAQNYVFFDDVTLFKQ